MYAPESTAPNNAEHPAEYRADFGIDFKLVSADATQFNLVKVK